MVSTKHIINETVLETHVSLNLNDYKELSIISAHIKWKVSKLHMFM